MELKDVARWSPAFGAVGAVLTAGAALWWIVSGSLAGVASWAAGVGGVLLIAYAVLDRDRLADTASTRVFLYSARSWLAVALSAGIAVGTYTLAYRSDVAWDWTGRGLHTLSDQAIRVASSLDDDVKITAFYGAGAPGRARFHDLARRFDQASDRITVEYVDPLAEPSRAAAAGVDHDLGTVRLVRGDREERLEGEIDEEDVVRALVRLQSGEDRRLCWSVGHGEPDPDDEVTRRGLGAFGVELERLHYTVTAQRIAQAGVDRGCDALIVVSPTTDLAPSEREAIAAYVAEGGRVLFLLDPFVAPALSADLERYGVRLTADAVRDADRRNQLQGVQDMAILVLSERDFANHPITRNLRAAVVLADARSVDGMLQADGLKIRELLFTSPEAWGETDPERLPLAPDPGVEEVGPLPVMVAVQVEDPAALRVAAVPEGALGASTPQAVPAQAGVPSDFAPVPGGRVVVVGDSDFAGNTLLGWGNNRDLALNAIAWLLDEEDRIGERPEPGNTLVISEFASTLLCLVGTVLVPGASLAMAGLAMLRRRRL